MTEGYKRMTSDGLEIEGSGLTRASRDELLFSIGYSMRFNERGKATNAAKDIAIKILAERVLEHLETSNYVIMQRPPGKSWSTPGNRAIPMKD